VFGEKKSTSNQYFMDLLETAAGNDNTELERGRHSAGSQPVVGAGGSNHAFSDGSARYMKYWDAVKPLNMWAVNDADRLAYSMQ
jgi:hypothetical protein